MTVAYYVLVLLGVTAIGWHVGAARAFRSRILQLAQSLHDAPPTRDLPTPLSPLVADFAHRAGAASGARMKTASFRQTAELRLKPGGKFVTISAWQVISLARAGLVWDARRAIGPFTALRVLDSFVGAEGRLEARLFGSVPVARASGADINLGEAYRYLAELPWAPDAILGNPDLVWRVTGPDEAEVRLDTPEGTARVTFTFDGNGDIVGVLAKERPARTPDGKAATYEWRGRFGEYTQIGPRRLPAYGEVGYVYPGGYEVYFRGRISDYSVTS
ncbi:MAG: hypothetical protein KDE08_10135 [Rhodobacteraceae bacterium]|nr:hypothetical protein [Paracoccaceae bacterium]